MRWTMDLQKWAHQQYKLHPKKTDEALYAFGVTIAITVSQGKTPPFGETELASQPQETQHGYIDGIALMNKVVVFGDAPEGEIRDLLGAPHSEPLR
jgi:hypothetical protein